MSGRQYDIGINPKCLKCGSKMWTSKERNFNGPKCKNTEHCDGGLLDATYEDFPKGKPFKTKVDKDGNIILEGPFQEIKKNYRL